MKYLTIALALIILSLFGCSAKHLSSKVIYVSNPNIKQAYYICVDKKFNSQERDLINTGISEWDAALGDDINFNIKDIGDVELNDCRVSIIHNTSKDEKFVSRPRAIGLADRIGGRVVWLAIDRQYFTDEKGNSFNAIKETTVHEIGHTFWLEHTEGGIMNPNIIIGEKLSESDIELAIVWIWVGTVNTLSLNDFSDDYVQSMANL